MNDLLQRIQRAQIEAGERVVMEDLREKGIDPAIVARMPDEEFMRRLRARFIERAGEGADAVADGCTVAEWRDGFEDDPEGAADEEMSYWDDDSQLT